jgi:putative tryptophan/tyrosine transport system substrate-binding protein
MRRREFIGLVIGATAWPWPVRASGPVVGFLSSRSAAESADIVRAFESGLRQGGAVDFAIEYRWAQGRLELLPALAAELAARQVAVLVTVGGVITAFAANRATSSVPIVFVIGSDPVAQGLVSSLSRPGGNATGVTIITSHLVGKRLQLLRELAPAATVAIVTNPNNPDSPGHAADAAAAAQSLGMKLTALSAADENGIAKAFAAMAEQAIESVIFGSDPVFDVHRHKIAEFAARLGRPAIYHYRDYAVAGGLMSYGPDIGDAYRQAGAYTAQILKGARPADLPVVQPTKLEFVINLKTAKALRIEIPPTLLARADEVIE